MKSYVFVEYSVKRKDHFEGKYVEEIFLPYKRERNLKVTYFLEYLCDFYNVSIDFIDYKIMDTPPKWWTRKKIAEKRIMANWETKEMFRYQSYVKD